jgi:hypothetical protein
VRSEAGIARPMGSSLQAASWKLLPRRQRSLGALGRSTEDLISQLEDLQEGVRNQNCLFPAIAISIPFDDDNNGDDDDDDEDDDDDD